MVTRHGADAPQESLPSDYADGALRASLMKALRSKSAKHRFS